MRLLHDSGTEEGIRRALESADTAFSESLFQRLTDDVIAFNLDIGQIRNVVCRLLDLLYSHLMQSRSEVDYAAERADAFQRLEGLKFKMDMIFLVSERCSSCCAGRERQAELLGRVGRAPPTSTSTSARARWPRLPPSRRTSTIPPTISLVCSAQAYHETLAAYIGEKRIAYAARLLTSNAPERQRRDRAVRL